MTWPDLYRRMIILALAEWAAYAQFAGENQRLKRRDN